MSYFDIIDEDLIVKILDIRCNDIEYMIHKLEYNINYGSFELGFLTIKLKTTHEFDKDHYNYNDKYNINYGSFIYCSDIFLFKIIYYGRVIFVSYIYEDYINDLHHYEVVISEIFINPTMFILVLFTAISNNFKTSYPYIDGFNILSKKTIKKYNIVPEYGITYIEMISGSYK
jgi:hypothetical protein